MPIDFSLILNVLLLVTAVVTLIFLIKSKRKNHILPAGYPSIGKDFRQSMTDSNNASNGFTKRISTAVPLDPTHFDAKPFDEVIAVRKITIDTKPNPANEAQTTKPPKLTPTSKIMASSPPLMLFLVAKEQRQLAGYELLQTLLASGLRFGEGSLFHRHEQANGQGPVLCSLAAATPSGVFDLQNIGAFSVKGLCLFMQVSDNETINEARLSCLLKTARQLAEGLDTQLLNDKKQPLTEPCIARYYAAIRRMEISPMETECS